MRNLRAGGYHRLGFKVYDDLFDEVLKVAGFWQARFDVTNASVPAGVAFAILQVTASYAGSSVGGNLTIEVPVEVEPFTISPNPPTLPCSPHAIAIFSRAKASFTATARSLRN
jgi:hypothetical protein